MKILGIVAEYNPFHNGHKYHLLKSKEKTEASHTVVIMSGNYLQRGEPAVLDKWLRAEVAISEGADIVIELPVIFSCNSAEYFAKGSISLLNALNIVDYICFGSEYGNIEKINDVADLLSYETQEFREVLKKYLSEGCSFPEARQKTILSLLGSDKDYEEILSSPNNILAIEYLKALRQTGSDIVPVTIQRIKADYNSLDIKDDICSATAIRNQLNTNNTDFEDLKKVMPNYSFNTLIESINSGIGPIFLDDLEKLILYKLRITPKEEIKKIHDMSEGLENRFKNGSIISSSFSQLIDNLKTKRYPLTRIQRLLIKTLLGITKEDLEMIEDEFKPQYIRVLGFSNKGMEVLRQIKENSDISIITNLKRFQPQNSLAKRMIELDILATDIYSLLYKNERLNRAGHDYFRNPFIER